MFASSHKPPVPLWLHFHPELGVAEPEGDLSRQTASHSGTGNASGFFPPVMGNMDECQPFFLEADHAGENKAVTLQELHKRPAEEASNPQAQVCAHVLVCVCECE